MYVLEDSTLRFTAPSIECTCRLVAKYTLCFESIGKHFIFPLWVKSLLELTAIIRGKKGASSPSVDIFATAQVS